VFGVAIAGLRFWDNISEAKVFVTFIVRFVKLQSEANPYILADEKYFVKLLIEKKKTALLSRQKSIFLP